MKTLLIMLLLTTPVIAEQTFTGNDRICQQIGYLSSECKSAKMVPMHLTDEKIALTKASKPETVTNTINKTNNYIVTPAQEMNVSGRESSDDVVVTSYWE